MQTAIATRTASTVIYFGQDKSGTTTLDAWQTTAPDAHTALLEKFPAADIVDPGRIEDLGDYTRARLTDGRIVELSIDRIRPDGTPRW